jgi:hypothetical protein
MFEIPYSKVLVMALAFGIAFCSPLTSGSVSAQENLLPGAKATDNEIRGCWERTDSSTRYPTSLTYCFLGKSRLQGWNIHNGHGVDFYGRWKKHKSDSVSIAVGRASRVICNYEIDKQRDVLQLKNCTSPSVEGSFEKSGIDIQ